MSLLASFFSLSCQPLYARADDPDGMARITSTWVKWDFPPGHVASPLTLASFKERCLVVNHAYERLLGYTQKSIRKLLDHLRPITMFTNVRPDHTAAAHRISLRMRLERTPEAQLSVNSTHAQPAAGPTRRECAVVGRRARPVV